MEAMKGLIVKGFMLIGFVNILVAAYPDIGTGYHYQPGGNNFANAGSSGPLSSGGSPKSQSGAGFQQTNSIFSQNDQQLGPSNGFSSGGGFTSTSGSGYDYSQGSAGSQDYQEPIIRKHFYVHSAPEDDEPIVQHKRVVLGRSQKNYRVIFIKAPATPRRTAVIDAVYPKNEDKTVIYVLSRKPEETHISDIAQPAPLEPSKPEVYFIKYQTGEEALHAQHQIQAQYNVLGGTSEVSDEGIAPVSSVVGAFGGGVVQIASPNDAGNSIVAGDESLLAGGISQVNVFDGSDMMSGQSTSTGYLPPSK